MVRIERINRTFRGEAVEAYDITIYDTNGERLRKTASPLEISITLEKTLDSTLQIVHVLGENRYEFIEVLEVFGQSVRFRTDSFSEYLFVQGGNLSLDDLNETSGTTSDVAVDDSTSRTTSNDTGEDVTKTGETSYVQSIGVVIALMLLATVISRILLKRKED